MKAKCNHMYTHTNTSMYKFDCDILHEFSSFILKHVSREYCSMLISKSINHTIFHTAVSMFNVKSSTFQSYLTYFPSGLKYMFLPFFASSTTVAAISSFCNIKIQREPVYQIYR